jgi:hypothetical protein
MNLFEAKRILELPDNWEDDLVLLKKNYHRLVMKYHPDKSKTDDTELFIKVNEAYEFLQKKEHQFVPSIIDGLFKQFMGSFKIPKRTNKIVKITPLEYMRGGLVRVDIPGNGVCLNCIGTGYKMNNVCIDCLGDGVKPSNLNINIPSFMNLEHPIILPGIGKFQMTLNSDEYFYNKRLFCNFNISLKESLTGFDKTFKDPFGDIHEIKVNDIIKPGDGYLLKKIKLILKFNIIYPEKIEQSVLEQLKFMEF